MLETSVAEFYTGNFLCRIGPGRINSIESLQHRIERFFGCDILSISLLLCSNNDTNNAKPFMFLFRALS